MSAQIQYKAPHRLIVEGKDDLHSIVSLTKKHGWLWDGSNVNEPYIQDSGGVDGALSSLATAAKSYRRLGVVLDADIVVSNRWQAVVDRLHPVGVHLPDAPALGGTVVDHGSGRLGVWLMPDNVQAGALESFLGCLVPTGDPCWPVAQRASGEALAAGAGFAAADAPKAWVHTWLAWQKEPGQPFGTAMTAAVFEHDQQIAVDFVAWMRRVFLDP